MKKFVLSSLLFLILGGCGSFIITTAYAQTLSPAEAAALSQSLQNMKAELLNLRAQADAQTVSPASPASVLPSAQDIATVQASLQALTAALRQLNQTIAANPASLTEGNRVVLRSVLGDVSASLVAINRKLAADEAGGSIVMAPAATVSRQASLPVQTNVQVPPSAGNQGQTAVTAGNTAVSETAQVSRSISLSRGWMVTLVVIVLLLIVFLVWNSRARKNADRKLAKQVNVAVSSVPKAAEPMPLAQKPMDAKPLIEHDVPRSPVSSVVSPPTSSNS